MIDPTIILGKIRDYYSRIQLLTMHCCSESDPETIPEMIDQRSELLGLIAVEEQRLTESSTTAPNTGSVTNLRAEITSIITAITTLDKQLEVVIKNQMFQLKSDLSMLYKTSYAASAYAVQSIRR